MNRQLDAREPENETVGDGTGVAQHDPPGEEPMLYCPVCSNHLTSVKCKLTCARCGYYMSCADYY